MNAPLKRIADGRPVFSHVAKFLLTPILLKGERLINTENSITLAPGEDQTKFLCLSSTDRDVPHRLTATTSQGRAVCDCTGYKAHLLCAHALALADQLGFVEKYSDWHKKSGKTVTLDAVVAHGVDKAVGKKARNRTEVHEIITFKVFTPTDSTRL